MVSNVKVIEKICPVCGKTFETTDKRRKFCSMECRDYKPTIKRICKTCSQEFETADKRMVYCSDQCSAEALYMRQKAYYREYSSRPEVQKRRRASYLQRKSKTAGKQPNSPSKTISRKTVTDTSYQTKTLKSERAVETEPILRKDCGVPCTQCPYDWCPYD